MIECLDFKNEGDGYKMHKLISNYINYIIKTVYL
jgi:hypothetical protein